MTTPQGWYDDGSGRQRWWDGTAWTEHFAPAAAPAVTPAAATPHPGNRLALIIGAVAGGLILVIIAVLVVLSATGAFLPKTPGQAVITFNEGWDPIDCSKVQASVTEKFFDENYGTCDEFAQFAQDFKKSVPGEYKVTVNTTDIDGTNATVRTSETYRSEGSPRIDILDYTLVLVEDRWRISSIELVD